MKKRSPRKNKIDRTISVVGMTFESEDDAVKKLFPDCNPEDIKAQISQLERKMTLEESILYLFANNPEQNKPVLYHNKKYPSKLNLLKSVFPTRDPKTTYYYIFDYSKKRGCSFEEAIDRELRFSNELTIRRKNQTINKSAKSVMDSNCNRLCPKCRGFLKIRSGRYGLFYGCENYPKCKYTESYKEENN